MIEDPTVLVSLIHWNNPDQVLACVDMLQRQSYLPTSIVVTDNASKSEAYQTLVQHLPDDVLLITSETNRGYAGGHSLAVQRALDYKLDCVWILNTDVEIPPQTLSELITAYQRYGEAIYGAVPLRKVKDAPLEKNIIQLHRKYFTLPYREILLHPKTNTTFGEQFPTMETREVAAVTGSCIFIPVSIIRAHGFMDESFFLYAEEIDYCFRVRAAGIPCLAVPSANIFHHSEGTSRQHSQLRRIVVYYRLRNQLIHLRRNGTAFDVWRAVIKNMMFIVLYTIQKKYGLETAKIAWRATLDGLAGKTGKRYAPEDYLD